MCSVAADNILRLDSLESFFYLVLSGPWTPICNPSVRFQIGRVHIGAFQGLSGPFVVNVPYRHCYRMGIPIRVVALLPLDFLWRYIPLDLYSTTKFEKIQYGLLDRSLIQDDSLKSADPRFL